MKNIFENAKFGDKFLTKDRGIALFLRVDFTEQGEKYCLSTEDTTLYVNCLGRVIGDFQYRDSCYNIISRYKEPIDEEELDALAMNYANSGEITTKTSDEYVISQIAFRAGYRKAKEE